MSDLLLGGAFILAAAVSIGASWVLVARLERVGARLGLSEALLGMLAALAADAPEITAAVTALIRHDPHVGAGVVVGSNVFNLAASAPAQDAQVCHVRLPAKISREYGPNTPRFG